MLIMLIKTIKNRENIKHKSMTLKNTGTFNNTVHGTFSVKFCNPLFQTWQFIKIWL